MLHARTAITSLFFSCFSPLHAAIYHSSLRHATKLRSWLCALLIIIISILRWVIFIILYPSLKALAIIVTWRLTRKSSSRDIRMQRHIIDSPFSLSLLLSFSLFFFFFLSLPLFSLSLSKVTNMSRMSRTSCCVNAWLKYGEEIVKKLLN